VPTFKSDNGLLLVNPLINGQNVGWMLADTGASGMVIEPDVADALKMSSFGSFKVNAVGGQQQTRWRVANSFQLGPLFIQKCGSHAM
jgi:predicted aspartyl protease